MTKSRNINAPRWRPTIEQLDELRRDFPTTPTAELAARFGVKYHQIARQAETLGIRKSEAYLNAAGGRTDGTRGMGTRFQPGHTPWSKGKKIDGPVAATAFKPGNKPHNHKPIGSVRVAAGYAQQKVTDTGYPPRDWVMVHRLVWEREHGPIPDGFVVGFRPGRRTTDIDKITPDALELVSRVDVMKRNSLWTTMPRELAELARLRGTIVREINKQARDKR